MATGGGPTTVKADCSVACSLCMESYGTRRRPKLLPCSHTLCLPCLILMEARAKQQETGGPKAGQQTDPENSEGTPGDVIAGSGDATTAGFMCPTCRASILIPKGGVSVFQNNDSITAGRKASLSRTELINKLSRLDADIDAFTTMMKEHKDRTEITDAKQTKIELTQTQAELTQTKRELTRTQAKLMQTEIELMRTKTELTRTKTELIQTQEALTKTEVSQSKADAVAVNTTVKEHIDRIAKAATVTMFQVWGTDTVRTKQHQPTVFRHVRVNESGCYNQSTGVFTAPEDGSYVFGVAKGQEGDQPGVVQAWILVDGTYRALLHGYATATDSNSVTIQLAAGQRVWVEATCNVDDYVRRGDVCFIGARMPLNL